MRRENPESERDHDDSPDYSHPLAELFAQVFILMVVFKLYRTARINYP
jgi:hypothetical protein